MAANTTPRFSLNGDYSSNNSTAMAPTLTTAAADYTGVSANNAQVFKSNATNGGRIAGLHFEATGTNTQSVARIYVNNGSTQATATNNSLVGKITLPASTASNTVAEQTADFMFPGGVADLQAGFVVFCGLATTVAAGWVVTPIMGGQY